MLAYKGKTREILSRCVLLFTSLKESQLICYLALLKDPYFTKLAE
jgi:hypothetical protein